MFALRTFAICASAASVSALLFEATQSEGTSTPKSRMYASLAVKSTQIFAANPQMTSAWV